MGPRGMTCGLSGSGRGTSGGLLSIDCRDRSRGTSVEATTTGLPGGHMEIVVRGRNVEVPEHFRQHVWDKVSTSDRFDGKLKINRIDVELFHEKNPRQTANCQRVEITLTGKGPVVRAEACGPDFYAALDLAAGKLDNRMRRAARRRRVHYGRRTPDRVR